MDDNGLKQGRKRAREYAHLMPEIIKRRALFQSWEQIAKEVEIPQTTLRRHYRALMEQLSKDAKGISEELIQEYLEREKIIIKRALSKENDALANTANNGLFDRMQSIGRIPQAAQKVELQGAIQLEEIWNKVLKKKS